MPANIQDTIALLTKTPAAFDALLRGLPERWTMRNEGENTWSPYDVIGHLVHGEHTDWIPRMRRIMKEGESRPFEAFNREAQFVESKGKSLGQLLDDFARLRGDNIRELRAMNLKPEDFEKKGTHPSLGSVTLSELLATWAAHDLTHLHQVSRIMAHQYRDSVGPWTKFLGVLKCGGHSE